DSCIKVHQHAIFRLRMGQPEGANGSLDIGCGVLAPRCHKSARRLDENVAKSRSAPVHTDPFTSCVSARTIYLSGRTGRDEPLACDRGSTRNWLERGAIL